MISNYNCCFILNSDKRESYVHGAFLLKSFICSPLWGKKKKKKKKKKNVETSTNLPELIIDAALLLSLLPLHASTPPCLAFPELRQ
jgi:hypothetical protein